MSSGQFLVVTIIAIAFIVIATLLARKNRHRLRHLVPDRLRVHLPARQKQAHEPGQPLSSGIPARSAEENSRAELNRLQEIIDDRKRIAWETDISYHLWSLYKSHFRFSEQLTTNPYLANGEWYDVKILSSRTHNGLNEYDFELQGVRYRFVDDEEQQGWRENLKYFSLYLYDDSDHCLIEVPMKMRVDKLGRNYAILSEGPKAFLPGGWINDFINVKLKHQRLRNQEIRAQKHRERLSEIEELKERYGIQD